MCEYLALADSWDYLAIGAVLVSLFLLLFGIRALKNANSDIVDEKKPVCACLWCLGSRFGVYCLQLFGKKISLS